MSMPHSYTLHSQRANVSAPPVPMDSFSESDAERQARVASARDRTVSLFSQHRGKLAVGAAAMLGLAIYYRWREARLARSDPEGYERLRRLTAAIDQVDADLQPEDSEQERQQQEMQ